MVCQLAGMCVGACLVPLQLVSTAPRLQSQRPSTSGLLVSGEAVCQLAGMCVGACSWQAKLHDSNPSTLGLLVPGKPATGAHTPLLG